VVVGATVVVVGANVVVVVGANVVVVVGANVVVVGLNVVVVVGAIVVVVGHKPTTFTTSLSQVALLFANFIQVAAYGISTLAVEPIDGRNTGVEPVNKL
jgi:hypothetical protein